jgi:hypothetical protein
MDYHQLTVLGQLDIEFNTITACFPGLLESEHGVLWVKPTIPSVGVNLHNRYLRS